MLSFQQIVSDRFVNFLIFFRTIAAEGRLVCVIANDWFIPIDDFLFRFAVEFFQIRYFSFWALIEPTAVKIDCSDWEKQ